MIATNRDRESRSRPLRGSGLLVTFVPLLRRWKYSIVAPIALIYLFTLENSLDDVFSKNDTATKSPLHRKYHSNTTQRSKYGYHHPQPPYPLIQHISHTCLINRNTSSEQVIHLPTAVPHLILIGAQKSATSEFQVLADKYTNVITPLSAKKFEPHFLDFQVEGALMKMIRENKTAEFDNAECRFRQKYTAFFNMSQVNNNTMSVVMEKTPSYLLLHNLPLIIDVLCPWEPKILVILRDPVDRAWSHYRMSYSRTNLNQQFATIVKNEIDNFIANGLLDNATMSLDDFEAALANNSHAPSSPFVFPKNMTLEKYAELVQLYRGNKKKEYLIRGLYAPLLLPWVKRFAKDDRLMVMKFNEVFNASIVDEVLRFAGVEDTSVDEHYDDFIRSKKGMIKGSANKNLTVDYHANKGVEMPLDPTIRLYLKFLYQPFNRFLVQLLGEEWDGWGE